MKYVIILPDGVADVPIQELGNKTPLEVAKHPNMDWVAANGITGWSHTIPSGFAPGSDVGCMSVFGYDPRKYFTGRAPLEAAAQGIALRDKDVVFRCNTVTVQNGVMADYSAGHIETTSSKQLIETLDQQLGKDGVKFYPGVSYRHLAVVDSSAWGVRVEDLTEKTTCTPPHDISGKQVAPYFPTGPAADKLNGLMMNSGGILESHPVNQQREREGKPPANRVWFWGQGTTAKFPSFQEVYGLRGACISAVDIVRGLGTLVGFEIIQRKDFTGYFDTNYKGKAEEALNALDHGFDFVLVHVEPTDEAGHMGDAQKKVQAIEDTDRLVVGTLLDGLKKRNEPFAVLIVCDHPTSTALKTHIAEPVPFALYATGITKDAVTAYNESAVKSSSKRFEEGFQLMPFFLQQGRN